MQRAKNCNLLYCHLWPVLLYHIFPLYLIRGSTILGKNLVDVKRVF